MMNQFTLFAQPVGREEGGNIGESGGGPLSSAGLPPAGCHDPGGGPPLGFGVGSAAIAG